MVRVWVSCVAMRDIVALLLLALACGAVGEMHDVLEPQRLPPMECKRGCATWADLASSGNGADQAAVNMLWQHGAPPANAGSSCAQPGRAVNFTGLSTFTKPADCPHMLPGECPMQQPTIKEAPVSALVATL